MQEEDLWQEYVELVSIAHNYVEWEKKSLGEYAFVPGWAEKLQEIAQEKKASLPKAPEISPPWTGQKENLVSRVERNPSDTFFKEHSPSFDKQNALSVEKRASILQEIKEKASVCKKCDLAHQGRTQVIFGSGPITSRLIIISDFPGFEEDKEGLPIAGEPRQLLIKMLASIQIALESVYLCSCLQCRVSGNYTPQAQEILACREWLLSQIRLLKPSLILTLGPFAAHKMTGIAQAMWKYRGNVYNYEGIPIFCTYHPKYLLQNPDDKKNAWQDLLRVQSFLQQND